jgi:hypothetical protein
VVVRTGLDARGVSHRLRMQRTTIQANAEHDNRATCCIHRRPLPVGFPVKPAPRGRGAKGPTSGHIRLGDGLAHKAKTVRSIYPFGHMPFRDITSVNHALFMGVSSDEAEHQSSVNPQGGAAVEQIRVGTAMSCWYRWSWLRTILGTSAFVSVVVIVLGDPKAHGFGSAVAVRVTPFLIFVGASLILLLMGRLSSKHPRQVQTIARVQSTSMTPQELLDALRKAGGKWIVCSALRLPHISA